MNERIERRIGWLLEWVARAVAAYAELTIVARRRFDALAARLSRRLR
jgi:hypothetical protein